MSSLIASWGLVLLFGLICLESAGIPLPGETALITAAVLAAHGDFDIASVIVVAASGAIAGDNIGYWAGRLGGRRLLERWPRLERHSRRVLPRAEAFFERHGSKTVFIGRFVALLRVTAAWMAGVGRMHWWKFLIWNALGGIAWATGFGLIAYYAGKTVAHAIEHYGLIATAVAVAVAVLAVIVLRLVKRRLVRIESEV